MLKRSRLLVLAMLSLLAAAAFAAEVTERTLPNGLKVLVKEVHAAPVVVVDVWYKVGSRNETAGITGSSHLLEHMTYKGTKQYAKDDMRNLTKRNGAIDNGATYYDYTHYYTTIASDRLELVLKMEASRMSSALIKQEDLDSEFSVVRSELEGNENNPGRTLFQQTMAAAFTSHPYHWPVIGWRPDIEHVTADQLRAYYHKYYVPNNATLVIVGDVPTDRALALAMKYFGKIKQAPNPPQWVTPEPAQQGERRITIHRPGQVPIELMMWHIPAVRKIHNPSIGLSDDMPALSLLEYILGSGRLSRLYQQVVEKRVGISAWTSTMPLADGGVFTAGGAAAPGQSLAPVEQSIFAEIERIKQTPPSKEEIQRALRQIEAEMIYARDSVTSQAAELGEAETVDGDWRYPDEQLELMRKVSPEDISRVARQYLTEDNRTVGIFQPVNGNGGGSGQPSTAPAHYHDGLVPIGRQLTTTSAPVQLKVAGSEEQAQQARRERIVLPNGIVLIVQENHANPTVAVSATLRAGKAYDPHGKTGVADMVANLLDRGTQTRTSNQIAEELEGAAASIDTGTGWETVGLHGKALSGDTDLLIRNMADEVRNAIFPQDEIDKMREQMLSGLAMEREDPDEAARRAFYRASLPEGNPYRIASFDEEEAGLKQLTRDDLLDFYHARYTPNRMIIAVVGDISVDAVKASIERAFGDWKGNEPPMADFDVAVPQPAQRVVTTIPDKTDVQIYAGFAGGISRTNPDYYAAEVMNMILGGGGALNSRLGDVIRDQHGLAYTVYSDFHASSGAGPWYAELGVNPANVDKAIALLQAEIARMRDNGVTQREVDDAVAFITGSYAIALETDDALANTLQDAEYFHLGLDYPEQVLSRYKAVTREQVNAAAKTYLYPDKLTISIAGTVDGKKE